MAEGVQMVSINHSMIDDQSNYIVYKNKANTGNAG